MTSTLARRLRIVSDKIWMGEKIEWGSETALMDEAADYIEQREEAASDKWLPISEAPRDGTELLLNVPKFENEGYWISPTTVGKYSNDYGWMIQADGYDDWGYKPSHFQYITPPKGGEHDKP